MSLYLQIHVAELLHSLKLPLRKAFFFYRRCHYWGVSDKPCASCRASFSRPCRYLSTMFTWCVLSHTCAFHCYLICHNNYWGLGTCFIHSLTSPFSPNKIFINIHARTHTRIHTHRPLTAALSLVSPANWCFSTLTHTIDYIDRRIVLHKFKGHCVY